MPKYISLAQYKLRDEGFNLNGINDIALASLISRAEAGVDAYMGFDPRLGGFEPHVISFQQGYDELHRKTSTPLPPVPMRRVVRYRIQLSNLPNNGAGFFATINNNDIVVNVDEGYLEIVSLQTLVYSLAPMFSEFGLRPPIVQTDVEVGYFLPKLAQPLYNAGNNTTYMALEGCWATTYTVASAAQPLTAPPTPPVVYVNGIVANPSTYNVDAVNGFVTFATPNLGTDSVTADYTAQIPPEARDATIEQTNYLLAQRQLNKLGLFRGVDQVRNENQEIRGPRFPTTGDAAALCDAAKGHLQKIMPWGIG